MINSIELPIKKVIFFPNKNYSLSKAIFLLNDFEDETAGKKFYILSTTLIIEKEKIILPSLNIEKMEFVFDDLLLKKLGEVIELHCSSAFSLESVYKVIKKLIICQYCEKLIFDNF
jgi:hypothetical protein